MKLMSDATGTQHRYEDAQGNTWPYLLEKELAARYPNGGYRILGDLEKKEGEDALVLTNETGGYRKLHAYSGKLKRSERSLGYIPLTVEDAYVRIVGKRKGRWLSAMIAVLLLVTIFLGGLWLGQINRPMDKPVKIASGEMYNPNPENIRLPGITEVHAQAGDPHVQQLLLNVEGNAYNLTYTITLDDSGEVLYVSRAIPPGYGVRAFVMKRTFAAGEYPITIHVASSALDDYEGDSSAAFNAGELDAVLIVK